MTRILPGEVDRGRVQATHDALRAEGGGWAGTGDLSYDPSTALSTLTTVLRGYETLRPGEARLSRALDDRYEEGAEPEAVTKARERSAQLLDDLRWFAPDFLSRIQSAKSQTRGCANCGSQVAVRYLRVRDDRDGTPPTVDCPVCGTRDFCLPPGDRARKDTLTIRLAEAEAQVDSTSTREAKRLNNVLWVMCARPLDVGDGPADGTPETQAAG